MKKRFNIISSGFYFVVLSCNTRTNLQHVILSCGILSRLPSQVTPQARPHLLCSATADPTLIQMIICKYFLQVSGRLPVI
jgi:hypothetical protein